MDFDDHQKENSARGAGAALFYYVDALHLSCAYTICGEY